MTYDIAIIGAGPAGLTAGIYGARAGMKVVVFEENVAGGQIINSAEIGNYPAEPHISGSSFAQKLEKQVRELGVEFIFEKVEKIKRNDKIFEIISEDEKYGAKSVILAVGTRERKLGIDKEDTFLGRGVSYCATCDGAFYKNKVVAVNGGGNSALHEALYLSSIAKTVFIIHRRDEFRASKGIISKLEKQGNIKLILNNTIQSLNGHKKLDSITLSNGNTLQIDGLFVSIGRVSNAGNIIDDLNVNSDNYIDADESCKTNIPGIFVAGDVRKKEIRQLVTATSDGAISASNAVEYLKAIK